MPDDKHPEPCDWNVPMGGVHAMTAPPRPVCPNCGWYWDQHGDPATRPTDPAPGPLDAADRAESEALAEIEAADLASYTHVRPPHYPRWPRY